MKNIKTIQEVWNYLGSNKTLFLLAINEMLYFEQPDSESESTESVLRVFIDYEEAKNYYFQTKEWFPEEHMTVVSMSLSELFNLIEDIQISCYTENEMPARLDLSKCKSIQDYPQTIDTIWSAFSSPVSVSN